MALLKVERAQGKGSQGRLFDYCSSSFSSLSSSTSPSWRPRRRRRNPCHAAPSPSFFSGMLGSHRSQVDLLPHTAVEGKQCSVHGRRGIGPRQATNFLLTVVVRQSIGNSRSFTFTFTVRTEKDSEEMLKDKCR